MIRTIKDLKDLKEIIKDLPDDMEVMGYNGGNGDLLLVSYWLNDYPGDEPALVISTDL